jgi:hypothetical protein
VTQVKIVMIRLIRFVIDLDDLVLAIDGSGPGSLRLQRATAR